MRRGREQRRAEFADHLLTWPKPLQHQGFPLVLLWTPKAGCTSLAKWFFHQTGHLDEALAFHPWVHRYRFEVFQAGLDYFDDTVMALSEGKRPVAKLVRDPWQRAVSSYLHLCHSRKLGKQNWATKVMRILHHANGTPPGRDTISFREFAQALARRGTEQGRLNPHIARQFSNGEDRLDLRLLRLEAFEDGIRALEQEFGLAPAPLETIVQSHHHRGGGESLMPGAADLQVEPHTFQRQKAPPYESFYDDETRSLVAAAYAQDFEAYGYAPGLPARPYIVSDTKEKAAL